MRFRKMSSADRTRLVLNLVWLLALLALAIWIEVPHKRRPPSDKCESVSNEDTEVSASAYSKLVTSGYIGVRSRRVTIVPLREDEEPAKVLNNVCEQRWYLAKLVRRLSDVGAAVIVIDKTFGPDSCDALDPGTLALIAAVQTSPRPIVVAAPTHIPKSDPKDACLILDRSLDFGSKRSADGVTDKPAVNLGISRLNVDFRKVPVNWFAYKSDESFRNNEDASDVFVETLPYLAASLADPGLRQEDRLNAIRADGEHPFIGFIEPEAVSHLNALDFLCSGPDRGDIELRYSLHCADHKNGAVLAGSQVFVLGDDVPGKDRHVLFGNDVPGMYLHANYIESLLQGRYLRQLGRGWDITILALWVVVLYVLFWLLSPELALLTCTLLGAAAWYGIAQLVVWKGLYPDVWLQSLGAVALFLKYVDARGHRIAEWFNKGEHSSDVRSHAK